MILKINCSQSPKWERLTKMFTFFPALGIRIPSPVFWLGRPSRAAEVDEKFFPWNYEYGYLLEYSDHVPHIL
jgi:hypothetical protein